MMAPDSAPHTDDTVQHDLGVMLSEARDAAGMKQSDMAELLNKHQSTVSKIENGTTSISRDDLRRWLTRCEVGEAAMCTMMRMWELVNSPVRLRGGDRAPTPKWFIPVMEREGEAIFLRSWSGEDIHGLMQSEAYMLWLFDAARRGTVMAERLKQRKRRQRVFDDPGKQFVFIVSEAALDRMCKQPSHTVEDQLAHMIKLAQRDNITIRYLRYGASAEAGPSFVMLQIPGDPMSVLAYSEHLTGVTSINKRDLSTYETAWAARNALADSAVDTLDELHRRYRQVTSGDTEGGR